MPSIKRLVHHLREGTLLERLQIRLGRWPEHVRVHWHGARSAEEGARGLSRWAQQFVAGKPAAWVLSLGDDQRFHRSLNRRLTQRGVLFRSLELDQALVLSAAELVGLSGIICGYDDTRRTTAAAQALAESAHLGAVPFEHAAGINPERAQFRRHDEYSHTDFVSPVLLEDPTPYSLYVESLEIFEQKCGLRDYLDLYQVLRHVVQAGVPGDVAEFGSYKGHSGWLIARTLQALGSDKKLYMFDMFTEFPAETRGIDHFWNHSHHVDFAQVRAKLGQFPNVRLVQGEFTQTLPGSGVDRLALAYVDCDSYRATRYLIDALWTRHLAQGAALACEDYGHPALLGNRAAVHAELDHRPGVFRFFSQFSGLYIAIKL